MTAIAERKRAIFPRPQRAQCAMKGSGKEPCFLSADKDSEGADKRIWDADKRKGSVIKFRRKLITELIYPQKAKPPDLASGGLLRFAR